MFTGEVLIGVLVLAFSSSQEISITSEYPFILSGCIILKKVVEAIST